MKYSDRLKNVQWFTANGQKILLKFALLSEECWSIEAFGILTSDEWSLTIGVICSHDFGPEWYSVLCVNSRYG